MKFSTFWGIAGSSRWRTEYAHLATTSVHGLCVKLPNGNTVSIQWGPGNYSSNRDLPFRASTEAKERGEEWTATTAEIAAWRDIREGEKRSYWKDTIWHSFDENCGGHVRGWLSPEEVLEFLDFAASNELDVRKREYDYDLDEVVIIGHLTLRQMVLRGWFKFLEWMRRANRPEGEEE
mgnify:FL=1